MRILQQMARSQPLRTMCTSVQDGGVLVANAEVQRFISRCMIAAGAKKNHAHPLSANLTMADYRGHFSHGLNRLDMYVKDIQSGVTVSNREPVVARETAATAHVDGANVLGPVVGNFAMRTAMQKAKECGMGFVVAKGSNHFGIAGYYALQAADAGLLGLCFTNTSPLVIPTRARKMALGTNPMCLAAPGKNGDSFVLDMATSAVALGKIELAEVKGEDIPYGWGADQAGIPTHNPAEVVKTGGLMPLGGPERNSGYKGYGLAMMVEIFCGILSGSHYGPNVRRWKVTSEPADLGQCFAAIDPNVFEPGFTDRMQDLMDICRGLETVEGEDQVLVAGDPERQHMAKCDADGGITYHPNVIDIMNQLAKNLSIKPMQRVG